jgi:hypothetical protein
MAMQTFTFFLLEAPRPVPGFVFDAFPDTGAALAFAHNLLDARNGYSAVEVIRGETRIARLERPAG